MTATARAGTDGVRVRYSPTQLSMYLACPRKHFFQYVLGFRPPQSASQIEGSRIHTQIERPLIAGEVPIDPRAAAAVAELARIEAAGSNDLEARLAAVTASTADYALTMGAAIATGEVLVEAEMSIDLPPTSTSKDRKYVGRVDLADFRKRIPEVTDHKTMADLKWAKVEHELFEDVQMVSYGKWALEVDQAAPAVVVRHLAVPTRGRITAVATDATLTREHVERKWAEYLPVLAEMDEARSKDVADVHPKGFENGECDRFGGCPHKTRCAGAIFRREGAEEMAQNNSPAALQEKLAKLKAQIHGTPVVPPDAAPEAAPSAPAQADLGSGSPLDKLAKLRALKATPPTEDAVPSNGSKAVDRARNDPPTEPVDALAKLRALKGGAPAAKTETPPPAPSKTEPLSQGNRHTTAPPPKGEALPVSASRIEVLFLDCLPVRGFEADVVTLEDWAAPVLERIRQATGKAWQMHDYRDGPGLVCDGIATLQAPPYLVVDTSTPLGQVAREALLPRAGAVVRGTR